MSNKIEFSHLFHPYGKLKIIGQRICFFKVKDGILLMKVKLWHYLPINPINQDNGNQIDHEIGRLPQLKMSYSIK